MNDISCERSRMFLTRTDTYVRIDASRGESVNLKQRPLPHLLARLALPSKEAVDKILRYETTIERQLYRAMEQLERLQRRRKGEPTIPPITVDVMKEE